ncbi:hypothetical protein VTL71DRAFT_15109 [Oculimacula yallundae]|uniref:Uncharacterized protein n=1 Tax=Oculimacula yallundae TaxID=86028 RepID=A0ABR4CFM3_9HELO
MVVSIRLRITGSDEVGAETRLWVIEHKFMAANDTKQDDNSTQKTEPVYEGMKLYKYNMKKLARGPWTGNDFGTDAG